MEVAEQSAIRHAYRFSDKLKDRIYVTVSECYGAAPLPIFDNEGKPAMKFRLFFSKNEYEEKTVYIGDYIIFNKNETQILEVLKPEEFQNKYSCIE